MSGMSRPPGRSLPPTTTITISSPSSLSLSISSPSSLMSTASFFSSLSAPTPPSSPPPLARVARPQESDGETSYGTDEDLCQAMAAFDMNTVSHLIPPRSTPATPTRRSCARQAAALASTHRHVDDAYVSGVQLGEADVESDDDDDGFVNVATRRGAAEEGLKYYVVVKGFCPGIYYDWPSAKRQVKRVPGAEFKSFRDRARAEDAFRQALVDGRVAPLYPRDGPVPGWSPQSHGRWIAVFAGTAPGVYPSWLEAAPLVNGVRRSKCKGFATETQAWDAFEEARREGHVFVRP